MHEIYKELLVDNIHEIRIEFCIFENLGINKIQVQNIKNLLKEYLMRFPAMDLWKVCDYYCLDYGSNIFTKYNFIHNREDEKYEDQPDLAQYNVETRIIGFNQIRLANIEWDNLNIIKKLEEYQKCFNKCMYMVRIATERGEKVGADIDTIIKEFYSQIMFRFPEHEIDYNDFNTEYFDVILIRGLEESIYLKKILIHEIGHAVAYQYNIKNDIEVQSLFQAYKDGFEDIDEFIAECFMTSELTDKIPLANKIGKRIRFLTK